MPRYKISIEYDGTAYSGWQIQPNVNTIEEELERALSRILRKDINVIGQGRTDSGVHAEAQIAHFDIDKSVDSDDLLYALLGVLPRDISVWNIEQVANDFHARFDAKTRQYRYQIITRPSPLLNSVALLFRNNLDWEAMVACAQLIKGTHDFECFNKTNKDQHGSVCRIIRSTIERDDYRIIYRIRANRFVHHMVRRLMGSMLQVGMGRWRVKKFRTMLMYPDSIHKGHGAPAKGLILEKIEY